MSQDVGFSRSPGATVSSGALREAPAARRDHFRSLRLKHPLALDTQPYLAGGNAA